MTQPPDPFQTDMPPLPERARDMALSDAARSLSDRNAAPSFRDRAPSAGEPGEGIPAMRPLPQPGQAQSGQVQSGQAQPDRMVPAPGPRDPRRPRPRREGARDEGRAAAEALSLLAAAQRDLTTARAEVERLRGALDDAQARLLEQTQEAALMRRQRDGLQYRTDYLEEKLDLTTRALSRAPRPWWRRG
ncbi:MAG: hypothetical protein RLY86_745 [Pseudomonadota bacterium]|jgi:hypothetical protein